MKNILLSIDFSEHACNAAMYAAALAMQTKTRLILFHAFSPVPEPEATATKAFDTEREIQTRLDTLALKLQAFTGVSITRLLKPGKMVNETLYVAKKIKADLILVGVEKKSDDLYPLLDEQISDLIKRTEVPIMLIPTTAVFKPYKQVLLATGTEELEHDLNNLKFLNKLFFRFMAVNLVKVQDLKNQQEPILAEQEKYDTLTQDIKNLVYDPNLVQPELFILASTLDNNFKKAFSNLNQTSTEAIPVLLLPVLSKAS